MPPAVEARSRNLQITGESGSVVSDSLQNPISCSLPGSSIRRILQARILERVTFRSPGDLLNPGIKPRSPALQADSLPSEPAGKPRILIKVRYYISLRIFIKNISLF